MLKKSVLTVAVIGADFVDLDLAEVGGAHVGKITLDVYFVYILSTRNREFLGRLGQVVVNEYRN